MGTCMPAWNEGRLRIATEAAGVGLWSWNVDTDRIDMDACALDLWGVEARDGITFKALSARVLPADLERVRNAFASTRDLSGGYELDFRVMVDDEIRWISSRGRGDDEGIIGRTMFGVFLDITARKRAEEALELLAGEMQHRVKNVFNLVEALSQIASRSSASKEDMSNDLSRRLAALSSAHDMLYPNIRTGAPVVRLDALLGVLLAAYSTPDASVQSVSIVVPEVIIGENAVSSLAMIVHELATNSMKYGALSSANGKLALSCTEGEDDVELVWAEGGGPALAASPEHSGFGNTLTDMVVKQIEGSLVRTWSDEGVVVRLRVGKRLLAA